MSLATRCANCNTVFRVVQDQLKVSEGWVRCGRCGHVFNALEGLFDLGRDAQHSAPTPLKPLLSPAQPPARAMPPAPAPLETHLPPAEPDEAEVGIEMHDESLRAAADEARAEAAAGGGGDTLAQSTQAPDTHSDTHVDAHTDTQANDSLAGIDTAQALDTGPQPLQPSFVRAADRAAQWQRPRVRVALAVAALLAALVLTAQVAVHRRDDLAAQHPSLEAPLATLCDLLGCTIAAPRHIEALAVESSGLARIEGGSLHKLQLTLRNRHPTAVLAPAIELTLTDGRNEVLARRVLGARDFAGALPDRLAPGAEQPLALVLDLGERRVAGYTVELFYP